MIRYSRNSAWIIFYWWGGIVRSLVRPSGVYLAYLVGFYYLQLRTVATPEIARTSIDTLGGFVMYLLVFRVNQCMARHVHGNTLSAAVFSDLEFMLQAFCSYIKGDGQMLLELDGERDRQISPKQLRRYAEIAIVAKIHCVRLTVCLALSFVAHCWLLDAAAASHGELEEDMLSQVVFLHLRMQGLLFPEEMRLVDDALSISKDHVDAGPSGSPSQEGGRADGQKDSSWSACLSRAAQWTQACSCAAEEEQQPVFRAEVNRYRLEDARLGEPLFGSRRSVFHPRASSRGGLPGIPADERSVVPLPKLLSQLLVDVMGMPVDKPWGFPQRMMGMFVSRMGTVRNHMEELSRLVSQPLPLAYLQHCRMLLFTFALLYPMSVDAEAGVFENVVMPLITFATLYGFELLAADLENPLGLDDMDLNLLDMVHSLEVSAHQAFNLSEEGRIESRRALRRPFRDFGMRTGVDDLKPWQHVDGGRPPSHFSHYFCWQPMPTLVLAPLLYSHGHVDGVHKAFFKGRGLRRLLRRSLSRWRSGKRGEYTRLSTDPESPQAAKDGDTDEVLPELRLDPMIWCHFVALRRPEDHAQEMDPGRGASPVGGHRELWSAQLEPMLRGTVAASLFGEVCHESSDRTRLPSTPRVARSERQDPDADADGTASQAAAGACAAVPTLAPPPPPPPPESCGRSNSLQPSTSAQCAAVGAHGPDREAPPCPPSPGGEQSGAVGPGAVPPGYPRVAGGGADGRSSPLASAARSAAGAMVVPVPPPPAPAPQLPAAPKAVVEMAGASLDASASPAALLLCEALEGSGMRLDEPGPSSRGGAFEPRGSPPSQQWMPPAQAASELQGSAPQQQQQTLPPGPADEPRRSLGSYDEGYGGAYVEGQIDDSRYETGATGCGADDDDDD